MREIKKKEKERGQVSLTFFYTKHHSNNNNNN